MKFKYSFEIDLPPDEPGTGPVEADFAGYLKLQIAKWPVDPQPDRAVNLQIDYEEA